LEENNANPGSGSTGYHLVKIDSFSIENFTRVQITDYSPEEGIFLGFSEAQNDFLEIDRQGQILKRVNRAGDGPNHFGSRQPVAWGFGPNQSRIAEMAFSLIAYNPNYEITSRSRIISPLPIVTNVPLGRPLHFTRNDSVFYLVGPTNFLSAHYLIRNEQGRDTLQQFSALHLASGTQASILPYPESSAYRQTDLLYHQLMAKSFFLDNGKLVVVHNIDKALHVYDLASRTKLRDIPFEHAAFRSYPPLPLEANPESPDYVALTQMSARNMKLIDAGAGFWLMQYFQGMSEAEYTIAREADEDFSWLKKWDKMKIVLFKEGKPIKKELDAPSGNLLFGLGEGSFLVQDPPNPDVEEEVTRYSIYQITEDEL
jgi:hypothetical protein